MVSNAFGPVGAPAGPRRTVQLGGTQSLAARPGTGPAARTAAARRSIRSGRTAPASRSTVTVSSADEVRRARALGCLFDVELHLGSFREILAADVLHVEEHVLVGILGLDEALTARIVEEVNRTV